MARRLTRAEVPVEQTWRLTDLFATHADWESEVAAIAASAGRVTQYRGRLGEGAGVLMACLTEYERLRERMVRAATYANLRFSEDGSNPENQAAGARGRALMAQVGAALAFLQPEILLCRRARSSATWPRSPVWRRSAAGWSRSWPCGLTPCTRRPSRRWPPSPR